MDTKRLIPKLTRLLARPSAQDQILKLSVLSFIIEILLTRLQILSATTSLTLCLAGAVVCFLWINRRHLL